MKQKSRSITEWRSHLEPILVEKIGKLHETTIGGLRSLAEHPRKASHNLNRRTEEHSKMAQQADDLGIPMTLRPTAAGAKLSSPRTTDPTRFGSNAPQASGSTQEPTDGSAGSRGNEVDRRTLIIGQGISLAGELTSCDRLIVEGTIEAKLEKCQHVIIAETGVFNGDASTENADVRGRFEGDLVVRKRLLIRTGGHVSGTITYGEIEIESGGKITGTIEEATPEHRFSSALPISA
jgi:cytoskeletal protein CcmA (bactofilin family)